MPPVHGEQGAARLQRGRGQVQRSASGRRRRSSRASRSKTTRSNAVPAGQRPGTGHRSTRTCGNGGGPPGGRLATAAAETSQDSRASHRGASIAVSSPMEQPGSKALAVPRRRQHGHADRVLPALVPAGREPPRVRRRRVLPVEIPAGSRRSSGHRLDSERRPPWPRSTEVRGEPTSAAAPAGPCPRGLQLAGEAVGSPHACAGPARPDSGTRRPRLPGHPRVAADEPSATSRPGRQQAVPARPRWPARPARLVIGVQVPVPRREADVEPCTSARGRAGRVARPRAGQRRCRAAAAARPRSGAPSRPAPWSVSAARRRASARPPRVQPGVRSLAVGDGHQPQPGARAAQQRHAAPPTPEHLVVRVRGHDDALGPPGSRLGRRAALAWPGRRAPARLPAVPGRVAAGLRQSASRARRCASPARPHPLRPRRARPGRSVQISFRVMLPQVDGEIGDCAGVRRRHDTADPRPGRGPPGS